MLEVVLRAGGSLREDLFRIATVCAPYQTLQGCCDKDLLFNINCALSEHIDSTKRRIKSRCGGLLELIHPRDELNGFDPKPRIQFMHQTVKNFVDAPGFQKLFTHQGHSIPAENGYSFLYKAQLATVLCQLRLGGAIYPSLVLHILEHRLYGYQAERTTGKSQKRLFDELCSELFSHEVIRFSCGLTDDLPQIPCNSPLSLAVVSNLRLYVKETLEEKNVVNSNLGEPLLHWAAFAVARRDDPFVHDFDIKEVLTDESSPVNDLSDMIQLLFQYGADKAKSCNGLTAFQVLFTRSCFEGLNGWKGSQITKTMIDAARAFLENSQDPNVDIRESIGRNGEDPKVCKALHIATKDLVHLLLEFNADVNGVDGSGLTALDVCVGTVGDLQYRGNDQQLKEALDVAVLLLDNGACVTMAGLQAAISFANLLKTRLTPVLDDRLRNPPLLHSNSRRCLETIQQNSEPPNSGRAFQRLIRLLKKSKTKK